MARRGVYSYDEPIFAEIVTAHQQGQAPSLFQVAASVGCDYSAAWKSVYRLQAGGRLTIIKRGRGFALTLIPSEEP